MKRTLVIALTIFGTMVPMATAAQRQRNARHAKALTQAQIRTVLGRYALRDIRSGDATGYYITGLGTKSAMVHEIGSSGPAELDPSEPNPVWSQRIFVKRTGKGRQVIARSPVNVQSDVFKTRI